MDLEQVKKYIEKQKDEEGLIDYIELQMKLEKLEKKGVPVSLIDKALDELGFELLDEGE